MQKIGALHLYNQYIGVCLKELKVHPIGKKLCWFFHLKNHAKFQPCQPKFRLGLYLIIVYCTLHFHTLASNCPIQAQSSSCFRLCARVAITLGTVKGFLSKFFWKTIFHFKDNAILFSHQKSKLLL